MTDEKMDRLEDLILILRNENGSLSDAERNELTKERAALESEIAGYK
jgi:uncharacterized protein YdcH (DUF465 family)